MLEQGFGSWKLPQIKYQAPMKQMTTFAFPSWFMFSVDSMLASAASLGLYHL